MHFSLRQCVVHCGNFGIAYQMREITARSAHDPHVGRARSPRALRPARAERRPRSRTASLALIWRDLRIARGLRLAQLFLTGYCSDRENRKIYL